MKKLLLILGLVVAAMQMNAQTGTFTITGTADNAVNGDTVYLARAQGYGLIPLDSTLVKDGKFMFKGDVEGCTQRYVQFKRQGVGLAALILENSPIDVHIFAPDSKKEAEINGGPNSRLAQEFSKIGKNWNDSLMPSFNIFYYKKGTEAEQKAARAEFDSIVAIVHEEERQFILQNLPMPVCDLLLVSKYSDWTADQKKEVLEAFAAKYPESPNYKAIKADEERNAKTAVGGQYIDFTMDDPAGNPLSLSSIISKNKYTLIDFWASWCGPCRAEMPHVVKAYNENHEKGFEVIGVSLDNKKEPWLKAIDDLKMPWPQMSDLKGWQCGGAALYNVKAIPANVLVRQDGTIIDKNLRGEKLIERIAELMK